MHLYGKPLEALTRSHIGEIPMASLIKVTMNLTEHDVQNASVIHELTGARSRAHAVSMALSLARYIFEIIINIPGSQILIQMPDGKVERLIIPDLENRKALQEASTTLNSK
jgi:hypothetical protein